MRPSVDLRIILNGLRELSATPYFDQKVRAYSEHLARAIDFSLTLSQSPPEVVLQRLAHTSWLSYQYLLGSVSRESPYEMEFCLRSALDQWKTKECIFTTGFGYTRGGFHFVQADPWDMIRQLLPGFDSQGFSPALILISLPRLYQHKPIFCIPLYHELGHFVDQHRGLTNLIMLGTLSGWGPGAALSITAYHWAEHFADLFAASYVGRGFVRVLETIAPNAPATIPHPATVDRVQVIDRFLNGQPDPRIEAIRAALTQVGAPNLAQHFDTPSIEVAFDDLRTYQIQSEREMHGMLDAGWSYFERTVGRDPNPWSRAPLHDGDIETIVNDLTEKSLRNFAVRMRWQNAVADKG